MDGFCVNTIEPNRENAEQIIDLRKRDFRRVGLPLAEAKKLADKLGVGQYFPWKNIEEYLDFRLNKIGSSLSELKK